MNLPLLLLAGTPSSATNTLNSLGITVNGAGHGLTLSAPMQIALGLTLLTLLPAVVMCITPFLRIAVVLHFLRQALGTQSAPSNQVLLGLALFLTVVIMQPVAMDMYQKGWVPLETHQLSTAQAFEQGSQPLRSFLIKFARE